MDIIGLEGRGGVSFETNCSGDLLASFVAPVMVQPWCFRNVYMTNRIEKEIDKRNFEVFDAIEAQSGPETGADWRHTLTPVSIDKRVDSCSLLKRWNYGGTPVKISQEFQPCAQANFSNGIGVIEAEDAAVPMSKPRHDTDKLSGGSNAALPFGTTLFWVFTSQVTSRKALNSAHENATRTPEGTQEPPYIRNRNISAQIVSLEDILRPDRYISQFEKHAGKTRINPHLVQDWGSSGRTNLGCMKAALTFQTMHLEY
ncbi:hypothetical protein B0H17DRAFT_1129180 [Mycena rosella]|uniref:Uncharacterized protein n=1 Tax=Mycena rosella TaxID=1033263 RepID=A0AAD7GPP1_MYCRO|nr:hypothetical protein B0H17DRAFT_1129180 [Mycena rosella]